MLGEPLSMLVPQVVGFRLHGRAARRRDRDRPRADGDRDPARDRRRRQVRRVLRRRPRGPAARRPRDAREHVARVRRDVRLLPGRRADARLPAADRPQRGAGRARRGVLQGEPALARPGAAARRTRRSSSSTSATVEPSLAGPRRPQDRVPLARREGRRSSRRSARSASSPTTTAPSPRRSRRATRRPSRRPAGTPSPSRRRPSRRSRRRRRSRFACRSTARSSSSHHGAVVIAAITSCTNTSNPQVMIGAGLLAKKAVELGLSAQAVGEVVARARLARRHRVLRARRACSSYLDELGFNTVGYGCTTCIGNSGPLPRRDLERDRRAATSSPARCSRATATSRRASIPR